MQFISAALGGALGALGRYLISLLPVRTEFPVLTLVKNIIGGCWFDRALVSILL